MGITKDMTVLELGAGYGSWIRSIDCRKKFALDVNPGLQKIFTDAGIEDAKTIVGSCTDLGHFSESSVDIVLASNLLEHLDRDEVVQCFSEVARVLRPGGRFCVIQPNFALCPESYFDDYTHKTIFTHVSLKDWLESSGFRVTHTFKRFLPLSMKDSSAANLTFLVPLYLRSPWKPKAGQMAVIAEKKR